MSHHGIVQAIAACAVALILLLGAMSCGSNRVVGAGASPPTQSDSSGDYAENAMATIEPDAGENAMTTAEPPPPPPPPAPERAEGGDEHEYDLPAGAAAPHVPRLRPPATDTGPDEAAAPQADNKPFAGLGAFVQPPVWVAERRYTLEFVVGQNDAGLAAVSQNRALTGRSRIWMAPTMRVTLDPHPDFDIKPQNAEQEIQQLSPDRTANWFWNIVPHKAGKFTLVARVQAVIVGPDGEPLRDAQRRPRGRFYPAQQVDVQVKVGAQQGVMNALENAKKVGEASEGLFSSWQKALVALAALITAAGGVWAAVRKLQGKPIRPRGRKKAA